MLHWEKHEILTPPTEEEIARMQPEELVELHAKYHEAIANARRDPYRYGWVLPHWRMAEGLFRKWRTLLILGGNRSGKTTFSARAVVRAVTENPGALIYCFSQNQETSVVVQQAAVYEYLPEELKAKKTEATEYISYSMQNGFAGNGFVLPNKSRILFKTYSQFQQNQSILEGMELGSRAPVGINIGAWCDEYLQGMEMLDRLYLRLATRNAKMLLTFTPKDGVTETVKYYLDDAKTIETRPAELLGGRMVPYVQENAAKNTGIVYFHGKDNPWSGYQSIVEMCKAKGDDNYTLTAAYGVPTKSYSSKFPKFSRDVNVVKPSEIPTKDVTRYHIIDPAGAKNWFMCWIAVDPSDTWWVYREWPSRHEYGEWARYANGKWQTGEAAKSLGMGMRDYVDLIARLEADDGALPYERLIDPRLGQARYQGENGQSSIIEDLADHGVVCVPAPGLDIEDGLQALQTKLAWNTKAPRDGLNRPHFFVSEHCGNIIHSLGEYDATPASEALKDPIDCFDSETEILTRKGWVRFDALPKGEDVGTMSDDGYLEWQRPTEYHERQFDGNLVCAESQSISFAVTPNHRMLVYPQRNKLRFRLAKDICRQDTFPIVTNGIREEPDRKIELWEGKWVNESDWAEFLGWYVAEGSATGTKGGTIQLPGRGYSVYISQSRSANPEKCNAIESLLNRLDFHWAYRGASFVISSMKLWELVFPLGNSYDKHLPDCVYGFARGSLERMWRAMVLGDGWVFNGESKYATVSPELAEQVSWLLQVIGLAQSYTYTRMLENGPIKATRPLIHLGTRTGRRATVTTGDKRMLVHELPYSGMVYCVTVPNGTLVVRRNGRPLVCGNCLRYAAVDGIRYVDPKAFKPRSNSKRSY